jgi:CRP/FNR family transcriptional regulator, cyclic AMP receptor protein
MIETASELTMDSHPYFKRFKPEHFAILKACASIAEFEEGSFLFTERQKAHQQYLIMEGRVALELLAPGKEPWIVMTVSDGGIVGYAWAYPPHRYYYSARVVKKARVIVLDAEYLAAKCTEDYEFGYQIMLGCADTTAERLQATRLQLLNLLMKAY